MTKMDYNADKNLLDHLENIRSSNEYLLHSAPASSSTELASTKPTWASVASAAAAACEPSAKTTSEATSTAPGAKTSAEATSEPASSSFSAAEASTSGEFGRWRAAAIVGRGGTARGSISGPINAVISCFLRRDFLNEGDEILVLFRGFCNLVRFFAHPDDQCFDCWPKSQDARSQTMPDVQLDPVVHHNRTLTVGGASAATE